MTQDRFFAKGAVYPFDGTILMVESNFQRSQILPSEKAFAYKMRLEAMKRQAGRPSKENASPLATNKKEGF